MLLLSAVVLIAVGVSLCDCDVAAELLVPRTVIELRLLLLLCNGIGSPDTAAGVVRETVSVRKRLDNITIFLVIFFF